MTAAAKKQDAKKPEVQPQPQPAPATPTVGVKTQTAQPQPVSKQGSTITKLKEAWTAKGISLKVLVEKQDGKFVLLQPTLGWPIIRIGASGGIELPEIKSYPRAFDAAINGKELLDKQCEPGRRRRWTAASARNLPHHHYGYVVGYVSRRRTKHHRKPRRKLVRFHCQFLRVRETPEAAVCPILAAM